MMPTIPLLRPQSILSLSLGLFTLSLAWIPTAAQSAGGWNQFDVCVSELTNNDVSPEAAAAGCAEALIPKELSQCVAIIRGGTALSGNVALQSCFQVRRPVDLGNCVVDIQAATLDGYRPQGNSPDANALSLSALNSCRQSLLPGRHSECVIALSRDTNYTPTKAMDTCLAAEDFPRDLFPAYQQAQP